MCDNCDNSLVCRRLACNFYVQIITGRPKRSKSKRKSVVANESDDDGPNTYDYNDSFIDDADEEDDSSYSAGSDDSDWKPQGGDDNDDDDDVDELLTEARGFLRSKKMAKPV